MSPDMNSLEGAWEPEVVPAREQEEALDSADDEADESALELTAAKQYHCRSRKLTEWLGRRRVTKKDEEELAADADETNTSRVHVFSCEVLNCPVICSARVEGQKVLLTRDERADCLLKQPTDLLGN